MKPTIMTQLEVEDRLSIEIEPCGCPECSYAVQPGHFACSTVSDEMLELEARGAIVRAYVGAWRWFAA